MPSWPQKSKAVVGTVLRSALRNSRLCNARRTGHEAFLQRFGQPFHPMLRLHSMDLPMKPVPSLKATGKTVRNSLRLLRIHLQHAGFLPRQHGCEVCRFRHCRSVLLLLFLGGLLFPAQSAICPLRCCHISPGPPGDDLGREPPVHRIRVIWHTHGSCHDGRCPG